MSKTTKPTTRQMTITGQDLHKGAFADEKVGAVTVKYKTATQGYYGYYRSSAAKDRKIQLGPNDTTIVGTVYKTVTEEEANTYLAWVKKNCAWHRTEISHENPPRAVLTTTEFTVPAPKIRNVTINSTVHRVMSGTLAEDLAKVTEAKSTRVAAEQQKAKEAKAKRAAQIRKDNKAEKERQAAQATSAEFGDLAAALKTLKKHGLRIVTVEEKAK